MKKHFLITLICLITFFLSATNVAAENKLGINIGANHADMDKAAGIVGPGGWVVMMACPSDGNKIADFIEKNPDTNLIIRGHFPGQTQDETLATLWAATLASIPSPNKIYFMPWNEPNQQGFPDYGSPSQVVQYINDLKSEFNKYGLLGGKVGLLSPMLNQTYNASCDPNSNSQFLNYVAQLGGGSFFSQFEGIAMNLYDNETCGSPLCCGNPNFNASRFQEVLSQMGVPGAKVFAVESGILKNGVEYKDVDLNNFYRTVFPSWNPHGNFTMFAVFSYDPEHEEEWNIFSPGNLAASYFKSLAQTGNPQKITPSSSPVSLNKCPGKNFSFYLNSESECTACGGGGSFTLNACSPLEGNYYAEEYAKQSIKLEEKFTYWANSDKCINQSFTAKATISDLQIPFAKDLNQFFLGKNVDDLTALSLTNSDIVKNSGVFQRLAPKDLQDKLKLQFLSEIQNPKSRYINFKINNKPPSEIVDDFKRISNNQKNDIELTQADNEFLVAVWSRVPLFANEETSGEIVFEGSGVDSLLSKVQTSVPEVYRLNKVTNLLWQMLNPSSTSQGQTKGQTTQNGEVLAACAETPKIDPITNNKESVGGPGENVCTSEIIQPPTLKENNLLVNRTFEREDLSSSRGGACPEAGHECGYFEIKACTYFTSPCTDSCFCVMGQCLHNDGYKIVDVTGTCIREGSAFMCTENLSRTEHDECLQDYPALPGPTIFPAVEGSGYKEFTVDLNIKNRVPFLAQIVEKTVGPNGLFKIFTPGYKEQGELTATEEEIKYQFREVAGESKAKLEINKITPTPNPLTGVNFTPPSSSTNTITLLFHKLGTIFNVKEFISKAVLSPYRYGGTNPDGTNPPDGTPGVLDYTLNQRDSSNTISDANKQRVITLVKAAWGDSQIANKWDLVYNQAKNNGWNPAFVLALWIEESGASAESSGYQWALGCTAGGKEIDSQLNCLNTQIDFGNAPFDEFMCKYSEGHFPCEFTLNPNFPGNLKYWYNQLTQ